MRRIVSEVKSSFTTVFSVFEKKTLKNQLGLVKKKFFLVGFFHFLGIRQKMGFQKAHFLEKAAFLSLFATSSIYSESAQKTLPENIQFVDFRKICGNFGRRVGWSGIRFIQKKNATTFFSYIFSETT
jgi:hypothetical protein